MPILFIFPVFSTLAGGLLAVRFRNSLTLLVALGAGLLLGAAFLDMLPEAIALNASHTRSVSDVLGIALLSFLGFFSLEALLGGAAERLAFSTNALGKAGGALLIFHSLRDGMAIGLAYAASHRVGYAVAAGIAAHDLGDGMNTILLTTQGERPNWSSYAFLIADSLAPLLGGVLTIYWTFSSRSSVVLLAVAAGFFIQMATTEFLPQLRERHTSKFVVMPAVFAGAALIYIANLLIANFTVGLPS